MDRYKEQSLRRNFIGVGVATHIFRFKALETHWVQSLQRDHFQHIRHTGQKLGRLAERHHLLLCEANHCNNTVKLL